MLEDQKLREASEWWLRLREERGPDPAGEWLAWSQKDAAHLDAFDRIDSLALELRNLDSEQRAVLLREFAPSSLPPSPLVGESRGEGFFQRGLLAAAAVLLLALAAVFYFTSGSHETTYATERALHQEVTLPDGSLLSVGASSVVTVQMRADERRIHLREGEAYFKVQKDSARPFVVEAGDISITALGTAFDVRRTGRNVAVSVTEGRVRVMRPSGTALEVGTGERVAYEPGLQRFRTSAVSAERATAWRERRLEFVNEPLDVVIANVNRYTSVRIAIDDPAVAQLTFTGTVLPEELSSWLSALPSVLPVHVEREGNDVRLESASKP